MIIVLGLVPRNRQRREADLHVPDMFGDPRGVVLALGATIALLGYMLVVYPRSGVVQPWYTSNLIVPCALLLAIDAAVIGKLLQRYRRVMGLLVTLLVGVILARNLVLFQFPGPDRPLWPYQQAMHEAGVYLRDHPPDGRVGAWNAGIIGYYQGGSVINLDGLVNDGVHAFVARNALSEYLTVQRVRYIADFESMLSVRAYRARGGYDDQQFLKRLQPIKMFIRRNGFWSGMAIFEFVADSGAAAPQP
jgi:hypothetical protein